MTEDAALLRQFAEKGSESALRELVTRRIDFVYAAALRQVGRDTHLAREVTQSVFLDLARKARVLAGRASLTGWLYTSVRFAAAKALRSRVRRMNHETEAHAMNEILSTPAAGATGETDWNELRPVLDAAMHELGERDREAILLRFFEGRSLAEVGAATGLAENAARMRVERALEKLRARLARRGITSTAAALGVVLAGQPVVAAPAGLVGTVVSGAVAGAMAGSAMVPLWLELMSTTKMAWSAGGFVVVVVVSLCVEWHSSPAAPKDSSTTSRAETRLAALPMTPTAERARTETQTVATPAPMGGQPEARRLVDVAAEVAQHRAQREAAALAIRSASLFEKVGGRPTAKFAEEFGLTKAEWDGLNRAVDRVRQQLGELALANATVAVATDGTVTIQVRAFAEGGAAYDQLVNDFAAVLGPARYASFLRDGLAGLERALGELGLEARTITLRHERAMGGRAEFYHVREATAKERLVLSGRSLRLAKDYFGALMRLLPPDF